MGVKPLNKDEREVLLRDLLVTKDPALDLAERYEATVVDLERQLKIANDARATYSEEIMQLANRIAHREKYDKLAEELDK